MATPTEYNDFKEMWDTFDEDDKRDILTDFIPATAFRELIKGCEAFKGYLKRVAEADDPEDVDYYEYVESLNIDS